MPHYDPTKAGTIRVPGKSGRRGVGWSERDKAWVATIQHRENKRSKQFKSLDEAIRQREIWEREFGFVQQTLEQICERRRLNKNSLDKKYRLRHLEKIRAYDRIRNKGRKAKYDRVRLKNDFLYRLTVNYRNLINRKFKSKNWKKNTKTTELIGCTFDEYRKHIESQWEPWMTWENYGKYDVNRRTWQIDHIIPISSFDISDANEAKKAFNWKNCRPLDSKENLSKGNKLS